MEPPTAHRPDTIPTSATPGTPTHTLAATSLGRDARVQLKSALAGKDFATQSAMLAPRAWPGDFGVAPIPGAVVQREVVRAELEAPDLFEPVFEEAKEGNASAAGWLAEHYQDWDEERRATVATAMRLSAESAKCAFIEALPKHAPDGYLVDLFSSCFWYAQSDAITAVAEFVVGDLDRIKYARELRDLLAGAVDQLDEWLMLRLMSAYAQRVPEVTPAERASLDNGRFRATPYYADLKHETLKSSEQALADIAALTASFEEIGASLAPQSVALQVQGKTLSERVAQAAIIADESAAICRDVPAELESQESLGDDLAQERALTEMYEDLELGLSILRWTITSDTLGAQISAEREWVTWCEKAALAGSIALDVANAICMRFPEVSGMCGGVKDGLKEAVKQLWGTFVHDEEFDWAKIPMAAMRGAIATELASLVPADPWTQSVLADIIKLKLENLESTIDLLSEESLEDAFAELVLQQLKDQAIVLGRAVLKDVRISNNDDAAKALGKLLADVYKTCAKAILS